MFNLEKLNYTEEIFDEYEKRFASARLNMKKRDPLNKKDREEIIKAARDVLALDNIPQPEIKVIETKEKIHNGIKSRHMLFESWDNCYGEAILLVPDVEENAPLIVVCCGHGEKGILTSSYQAMACELAKKGSYVLLSDNLGQGFREPYGHWDVIAPFYCGITLQGMIVSETMAWIRYMKNEPYIDNNRIGVCGNSGGGTLTTFLAALDPNITALASSGYPSEFAYILQKERPHCACNILKGFADKLDMWELYSIFAPKPILLSIGSYDNLIPLDYFQRMRRKVQCTYIKNSAEDNFNFLVTNTKHSWFAEDIYEISSFFERIFGLNSTQRPYGEYPTYIDTNDRLFEFPDSILSTDELAQQITGIKMPKGATLADAFPPTFKGEKICKDDIIEDLGRGNLMRVFSQFEASL